MLGKHLCGNEIYQDLLLKVLDKNPKAQFLNLLSTVTMFLEKEKHPVAQDIQPHDHSKPRTLLQGPTHRRSWSCCSSSSTFIDLWLMGDNLLTAWSVVLRAQCSFAAWESQDSQCLGHFSATTTMAVYWIYIWIIIPHAAAASATAAPSRDYIRYRLLIYWIN